MSYPEKNQLEISLHMPHNMLNFCREQKEEYCYLKFKHEDIHTQKEEINNLILLIAKWFSYEKTIDNNEYRFGYDFRERVKLNNFSRPINKWS